MANNFRFVADVRKLDSAVSNEVKWGKRVCLVFVISVAIVHRSKKPLTEFNSNRNARMSLKNFLKCTIVYYLSLNPFRCASVVNKWWEKNLSRIMSTTLKYRHTLVRDIRRTVRTSYFHAILEQHDEEAATISSFTNWDSRFAIQSYSKRIRTKRIKRESGENVTSNVYATYR